MSDYQPGCNGELPVAQVMTKDVAALAVMRGVFQHWLDYERAKRAAEGLETTDETHIITPPYWPTHGQLKAFIKALDAFTDEPGVCTYVRDYGTHHFVEREIAVCSFCGTPENRGAEGK